jgi:CheY-like chemotaxis protein
LLDLNLPGMDGRELLAVIKADEHLRHIPVVVVTGSQLDEDVLRSYRLHANAYVKKPIDTKEFLEAVNSIDQFWLQIVKLP